PHGSDTAVQEGQGLRCRTPPPRWWSDPDGPKCDPVRIPWIRLRLVEEAGGACGEGAVDAVGPEIGQFNNMGIGGEERIGRQARRPPLRGAARSCARRLSSMAIELV